MINIKTSNNPLIKRNKNNNKNNLVDSSLKIKIKNIKKRNNGDYISNKNITIIYSKNQ